MRRLPALIVLAAVPMVLGACGVLVPVGGGVSNVPVLGMPGDKLPGGFFIDSVDVSVAESFPVQLFVDIEGSAPTPCHGIVWEITEGEGVRTITVTTEVERDVMCAQVLEPHSLTIPLGPAPDLPVEVWVNGELVRTVEG